jgi:hypothetical protein
MRRFLISCFNVERENNVLFFCVKVEHTHFIEREQCSFFNNELLVLNKLSATWILLLLLQLKIPSILTHV